MRSIGNLVINNKKSLLCACVNNHLYYISFRICEFAIFLKIWG